MMLRWVVLGLVAIALLPGKAKTQEPWTWELTPSVGFRTTSNDFGPATAVSQVHFLSIREVDAAVSFGLRADLSLPVKGLALSLRGLATLPTGVKGGLSCFPGFYCVAVMLPVDSEMRTLSGTVGFRYRPWSGTGWIRPYLTAGVGLQQEVYSWPEQENGFLPGTDQAESSRVFVAGIGFDVDTGPLPLRIEFSDTWVPEGDRMRSTMGPSFSSAWPPRRESRHDLNVSLGVVLRVH